MVDRGLAVSGGATGVSGASSVPLSASGEREKHDIF